MSRGCFFVFISFYCCLVYFLLFIMLLLIYCSFSYFPVCIKSFVIKEVLERNFKKKNKLVVYIYIYIYTSFFFCCFFLNFFNAFLTNSSVLFYYFRTFCRSARLLPIIYFFVIVLCYFFVVYVFLSFVLRNLFHGAIEH